MFRWVKCSLNALSVLPTAQAVNNVQYGGEPADAMRKVGNGPVLLILFIAQFLWAPPYAAFCRVTLKVFGRLINLCCFEENLVITQLFCGTAG